MPTINKANGTLSDKAVTRIRTALQWMILFAQTKSVYSKSTGKTFKFRINFITLTLSAKQVHPDQYILHKMLFPFIKWLERNHEVTAYVWRAEVQPERLKNRGERCIHFHITLDKFIHWRSIRNKWNQLQLAHGYREVADDPNSTDVHSVKDTNAILGYMSKYFSKKVPDEACKVECKVYGMSRNLSLMNCTIKEEEHPDSMTTIEEFITIHTTNRKQIDYATIFKNNITMTAEYPMQIGLQLRKNYRAFTKGIISKKKFEVE
jgi:hypothetical protein